MRHGGLGLRQSGVAVAHSKLEPLVGNFMKVLCSQEIYKYNIICRLPIIYFLYFLFCGGYREFENFLIPT